MASARENDECMPPSGTPSVLNCSTLVTCWAPGTHLIAIVMAHLHRAWPAKRFGDAIHPDQRRGAKHISDLECVSAPRNDDRVRSPAQ